MWMPDHPTDEFGGKAGVVAGGDSGGAVLDVNALGKWRL